MLVRRTDKTELDLRNAQPTACKRRANAARRVYHWGLQRRRKAYRATGTSSSASDLHRELNALTQTDMPWRYAVSARAPHEALRKLDNAFAHVFRRTNRKQMDKQADKLRGKIDSLRCKTKKRGLGGFRLPGGIVVFSEAIQVPRLGRERVHASGYLPTRGVKVRSAMVSEQAGHWSVSMQIEQKQAVPMNGGPVVGVGLGVHARALCAERTVMPNPQHLQHRLKKIKRFHRAVSRAVRDGQKRKQAARLLGRRDRKVGNLRKGTLQQLTTTVAKTQQVAAIKDLQVAGTLKNQHLAQAIGAVGLGAFRQHLGYKAEWYGSQVIVADRWFASSTTCSCCERCGLMLDRNRYAAINLEHLADSAPDRHNAGGGERADWVRETPVHLAPITQEPDLRYPSG